MAYPRKSSRTAAPPSVEPSTDRRPAERVPALPQPAPAARVCPCAALRGREVVARGHDTSTIASTSMSGRRRRGTARWSRWTATAPTSARQRSPRAPRSPPTQGARTILFGPADASSALSERPQGRSRWWTRRCRSPRAPIPRARRERTRTPRSCRPRGRWPRTGRRRWCAPAAPARRWRPGCSTSSAPAGSTGRRWRWRCRCPAGR